VTGGVCYEYSDEIGKRVFGTFFTFAYVIPLAVIAVISVAILRHITGQRASSMVLQQVRRGRLDYVILGLLGSAKLLTLGLVLSC